MPEKETVIDFAKFSRQVDMEQAPMPIEDYSAYGLCSLYIVEATSHVSGKWFVSKIPCEGFSGDDWCGGEVELVRYDLPSQIKWKCNKCKNHGKIINFEDSDWDISNLPEDKQQQIIASSIAVEDPIELLDQLPEDELNDFLNFFDQYMDDIGAGEDIQNVNGGLSSQTLYQLLEKDWNAPDSPLKLNESLSLEDINHSLFFHNARAFLLHLKQQGSLPCTARGNLKRKAVTALIEQLRWPEGYIEEIQNQYTTINEKNVWLLHVIRILLELAGFIYRENNNFYLTEDYNDLLANGHAGQLYCRLFNAYFMEMNLGYIANLDDFAGLQETVSFTLYKLSLKDNRWMPLTGSMNDILLPSVVDQLSWGGMMESYVHNLLIKPLIYFGLLETRPSTPQSDLFHSLPNEFRKKPLFNQLLSFDIEKKQQNSWNGNIIPINNKANKPQTSHSTKMAKQKDPQIYQIKVSLKNISPLIWRRLQVYSDTLLPDLHKIIQSSMGWMNGHMHQFEKDGQLYSAPTPFEIDWPSDDINYEKVRIDDLLKKSRQEMTYEYDFGDGWMHTILLEEILPIDSKKSYPVCTKGKRNCPPDDCGGPWGYQEMLEAVGDPSHPEHEMYNDWIDSDFDPERFDKGKINKLLHSKNYGVFEMF